MSTRHESTRTAALATAMMVFTLNGCADRVSEPAAAAMSAAALRADAARVGDHTASVRWSAIMRIFISAKPAATKPNAVAVIRAFAYMGLAQYRAVVATDETPGRPPHASAQGAVAAASAAVLSALFPADASFFESQLQSEELAAAKSDNPASSFAAGEVVGRAVGADVVALAQGDRFDAVWTGTVPTGAGYWSSDLVPPRPPQLPLLGQMQPFFMESGNQFRPPPPPDFGSPEFLAALAEIRWLSDNRTRDQLRIANYWALTTGSLTGGFWNEQVTERIARYALSERRAAHAIALVHMAAMDATIACYDAKYTYWLIRPYRVDQAITTPVGRPNHPSYPSSHGCSSGAAAYVLGALFPSDANQLAAMADEAAESRLYAGIHYRFDKDAALRIGRQVADLALSRGVDGVR
jgi:hypothetical protein